MKKAKDTGEMKKSLKLFCKPTETETRLAGSVEKYNTNPRIYHVLD